MSDALAEIERELRAARKYRHLCADTIRRIAKWALIRHDAPKEAVKAAKRKLHQVFGAYCLPDRIDDLMNEVEALPSVADLVGHRKACRALLAQHSSTGERLEILEVLYRAIWRITGQPRRVLDLACGYHPFALSWMEMDGVEYHGCDIDERLIAALNFYLKSIGRPETAQCRDVLCSLPAIEVDVVFLLKLLPCLEQQETGASLRLLQALKADWAVVSYPLESLGGKGKGMRANYAAQMANLAAALQTEARELIFPNEIFYLIPLRRASR